MDKLHLATKKASTEEINQINNNFQPQQQQLSQ